MQVLKLCAQAGLVRLGHVALDGTKIKANASKHKAMSYERMKKREAELQAEVDGWLKAAEAADAAEDKAFGADKRGDEMPDWVKTQIDSAAAASSAAQVTNWEARSPMILPNRPATAAAAKGRKTMSTMAKDIATPIPPSCPLPRG